MATRPETVRVFAPAKINLFLHVTAKRADGFHDLQSLVAFADAGDVLHFEEAEGFTLSLDGPFAAALEGEGDNLVLRAARGLAARLGEGLGARIRLTKNLPVASGIGGGSADAAATLRGLLALWRQDTAVAELAATLGSDIPVCVESAAAFMEGRGERVTSLPALPPVPLVLVNPGFAVATADVFRRLALAREAARLPPPGAFGSAAALFAYLDSARNDLEAPACALAPRIADVLEALRGGGARLARMSGSGATCFGLFETAARAQDAAARIARSRPHWWVHFGGFVGADAAKAQ